MPNDEDFFSPEHIDERLENSVGQPDDDDSSRAIINPGMVLLQDLRALFDKDSLENKRSLQRVWAKLAEQNADRLEQDEQSTTGVRYSPHLQVLRPHTQPSARSANGRLAGRGWVALVAVLFICVMVGSMLLAHHAPLWVASSVGSVTPAEASPIPGYAFPGRKVVSSPALPGGLAAFGWAPDSKRMAIIAQNMVMVWDRTTSQYDVFPVKTAGNVSLRALAWAPFGSELALGTNPVQVFDSVGGNLISSFPVHSFWPAAGNDYQATITALSWSPDGQFLAIAAQRADNGCVIQIWNVQRPDLLTNSIECEASAEGVTSLSWSEDGNDIAAADGQSVKVWQLSLTADQPIFEQALDSGMEVAWSPTVPSWLAFFNGGVVQVWNVASNTLIGKFGSELSSLTWSPDGEYLATVGGNQMAVWDVQTQSRLYVYPGGMNNISIISWSPDGRYLASGGSSDTGDFVVSIWET